MSLRETKHLVTLLLAMMLVLQSQAQVEPLIQSHWAQDAPFNEMCPEHPGSGGRLCKAGCVAVAVAQVLHYYKKPLTLSGYKTYGLTVSGKRLNLACDFASLTLDWDHMPNTYTASSTQRERRAVAELMYACGVAASMQYSYSYSGADPAIAANGINSFFDGVKAQAVAFNVETLRSELRAGRPVLYSGSNSVEAHCFVVDGMTADGQMFHCNLGRGGEGDDYYPANNLGGYPTAQGLVLISPTSGRSSCTPMSELRGKYAAASHTPASSIEPGRWYILWNSGRGGSPYSSGTGKTVMNTGNIPSGYGELTTENAGQLVRFVSSGSGYYIQTGLGDYLGSFGAGGGTGVTTNGRSNLFYAGTIQAGYFWLRSGSAYLDTNGIGQTVVGWGTTAPTDTLSNSAWRLFPVSILDAAVPLRFEGGQPLTLRNTGYSQGYLVATDAADSHPTLRGVTKDHPNGLYPGAQYHVPADLASAGARWHIWTREGKQYLYNLLTRKYLTNTGDGTSYGFTATPTPINCSKAAGTASEGTLCHFNSGTNAQSYLCAATQLENPAAFWTASDEGSLWLVEEAVDFTPVQSVNLSASLLTLVNGESQQLVATVLPVNASEYQLAWSSSDEAVATVSAEGRVTAVGQGTATITVSVVGNSSIQASCVVSVGNSSRVVGGKTSLSSSALYVIQNQGTSGGYLVAVTASDSRPTLRGVAAGSSVHSTSYCEVADLTSPLSQWQIVNTSYDSLRDIYLAVVRNVGTGYYLADMGRGTPYVLTSDPVEITVLGSSTDFSFRASTLNYLTANPTSSTPASYSSTGGSASLWSLYQVGEIDGVNRQRTTDNGQRTMDNGQFYDLQGRSCVRQPKSRLFIQNGRKVIRKLIN